MKKNLLKKLTTMFIVVLWIPDALSTPTITFNGFASIVAGRTKNEVRDEVESERLSNIYSLGYEDKFSLGNESLFALQANANLGEGLSFKAMLLAKGTNDYDAEFFAAYASYELTNNLTINAGRIPWPLFQYTDYLDVGYAYPWVSPPLGVYDLSSNNSLDGVTLIYNKPLGDWDSTFQAHHNGDNVYGLKGSFSYDWLTLNLVYVHNEETTVSAPPYQAASEKLLELGFTQQAKDLAMDHDASDFISTGFNVDYDDWLVIGEYAKVDFDPGWFSDFKAYYLTLGYRLDDVLLHVTYDVQEEEPQLEYLNGLDNSALFSTIDFFGSNLPIIAIESFVRGRAQDYKNVTIGARFDFHSSAAFKVELTRNTTDDGDNKVGIKKFTQNLVRVGIDLVF